MLLGCIADDYTGATDVANYLVRGGLRTVQIIGVPDRDDPAADADAVVIALKSRTAPVADAVRDSLESLAYLRRAGAEQIYFKYCSTFDSTPAGNIGPVTDALLGALRSSFTIACPAVPENGRTVYRGHLFVGDVPLAESGMRDHPLTPMRDSNLVRVLQHQTAHKVGLLTRDRVALGAESLRDDFARCESEGVGIAVVDAIDSYDLECIGRAVALLPLVTAASGVAYGMARYWWSTGRLAHADRAHALPPPSGRRAIVSGSCSVATLAQVAAFQSAGGKSFAVDPLRLARGEDVVDEALAWSDTIADSEPLLVYTSAAPEAVREVQREVGTGRAGEMVEQCLARIALGLVRRGVRQLVVAGGETSGAVVNTLGIRRLQIGGQIDPGVPWTTAMTAYTPDAPLHLALKSGNFGGIDFFTKAFQRLASS